MSSDIEERVIRIIAEQALLDVDDVLPERSLADLGIDSLGLVESIFAIEEEFDVQIPFNANDPSNTEFDISSVRAIVDAIDALVAQKA